MDLSDGRIETKDLGDGKHQLIIKKAKMEDMAREFGGMLKETLDKMRERIELSSTNLDMDGPMIPSPHELGEYA